MKYIALTISFLVALSLSPISPAMAVSVDRANYIVVLNEKADVPAAAAREIAGQVGGQVGFIYEHALKGFSITLPAQALAALERNPQVDYVTTDDVRYVFGQEVPTGIERIFAAFNAGIGIDDADDYRVDVDVAVIDTGVDFQHPDLNVVDGVTCSGGSPLKGKCAPGGDDDHYHGTHVAGTIGAIDNGTGVVGVAPGARIWAVKVLNSNGSGYTSWIVAGLDWVAANADKIEVANMSLGGSGFNQAEYDAIQGCVDKGVAFAVAAGNSDADANNYSPAAFDNVLTVSALADFDGLSGAGGVPTCRMDQDDTLADFSNWGSAVDIAAPGVCIRSTFPIERGEYGILSGTSMASPHVAGALALLASNDNPDSATDVYNLYAEVVASGNFNWTDDSGDGIQESLLDAGSDTLYTPLMIASGETAPVNNPPTVKINSPKGGESFGSGAGISFAGTGIDTEDGDISDSLNWTSSIDGAIGTGESFSTVLSDGWHTITSATIDSAGEGGSDSVTITVGGGNEGGPILTVSAYKVKGSQYADLAWDSDSATSTNMDVHRDGAFIESTPNDGAHTDGPLGKGGGSATYQICEAGTSVCSEEVLVNW